MLVIVPVAAYFHTYRLFSCYAEQEKENLHLGTGAEVLFVVPLSVIVLPEGFL